MGQISFPSHIDTSLVEFPYEIDTGAQNRPMARGHIVRLKPFFRVGTAIALSTTEYRRKRVRWR